MHCKGENQLQKDQNRGKKTGRGERELNKPRDYPVMKPAMAGDSQKENNKDLEKKKQEKTQSSSSLQLCNYSSRFIRPEIAALLPSTSGKAKNSLYCYQDDVLEYLLKIEKEFLVKSIHKRKKSKILAVGIEFFKKVNLDKHFKPETLLTAAFLWHKVFNEHPISENHLEKYIAPCLWIACKLEEYYPMRADTLCSYTDTFLLTKLGSRHLVRGSLTPADLIEAELEVLAFMNFQIKVPSFMNLLHIFEAVIFPERRISCSRFAVHTLESCYHHPDLFFISQANLAVGSLAKLCQDRDEDHLAKTIFSYIYKNNLQGLLNPKSIVEFMTKTIDDRRKELLVKGPNTSFSSFVDEVEFPNRPPQN